MLAYIGIDPGKAGALALIDADSRVLLTCRNVPDAATAAGFLDMARKNASALGCTCVAALEKVSAMRKGGRVQGVASTFSFGRNVGWWEGVLSATRTPWLTVTPRRWQSAVLDSGGGTDPKAKSLAQARRLWPDLDLKKRDDGIADALHIARWCLLNFATTASEGRCAPAEAGS